MKSAIRMVRLSGLFDEDYYVSRHIALDPLIGVVDPLSHYLSIGYAKGYLPSPHVDIESYLNRNPDVFRSGVNPLLHYIRYGEAEGRKLPILRSKQSATEARRLKQPAPPPSIKAFRALMRRRKPEGPPVVDVIMPVYAGYRETLQAIYAVLSARNKTSFELIVVDDCAPEARLASKLTGLSKLGLFTLLRNKSNLGFTRSVNLALRRNRSRDVILLNNDAFVNGDWIDRMLAHARPDVATITPFSNNATLCSYPVIFEDNDVQFGSASRKLDMLAAHCNRGKSVDVPTGVGFCFFMSRRAINAVGMFDARTFGAGYGEENDFCLRAASAGFRNVHALDIFVYHAGATSFGSGADKRKERNLQKLQRKHPDYTQKVREFARADPSRTARQAIDLARITSKARGKVVLCFSHVLGGGIEHYLVQRAAARRGHETLIVARPEIRGKSITLEPLGDKVDYPNLRGIPFPENGDFLRDILATADISHIEVHSSFGYHSDFTKELPRLSKSLGLPYDFHIHDYLPVCPRITFVDDSNQYCGEKGPKQCRSCLRKGAPELPHVHADLMERGSITIGAWRSMYRSLLSGARNVFCPSKDAGRRLRRYLPGLHVNIVPHEQALKASPPRPRRRASGSSLRIGLIGGLSIAKGALVMAACAQSALAENQQVEFVLIGHTPLPAASLPNVTITGKYRDDDVQALIRSHDLDCLFLPSIIPETYMYTLSHAVASRLPVFVFNLGAQGERIRAYPLGYAMPLSMARDPRKILQFITDRVSGISAPKTERTS